VYLLANLWPLGASFPVPEGFWYWTNRSALIVLAAPNPQKLSTAQLSYTQKIYENVAFNRFQILSVEIIEEKTIKKLSTANSFFPAQAQKPITLAGHRLSG
jgi:hypothetical protein